MTWPFLHRSCTGLSISETAIHRVDVSRSPRGCTVDGHDMEPVEGGDVAAALQRLLARMDTPSGLLATHLDDSYLWQTTVDLPAGLQGALLDAWAMEEAGRQLPEGLSIDALILRWTRLPPIGGADRLLLVAARREAVAERVDLLHNAGLDPVSVGSLVVEVGHAFVFSPSWVAGPAVIVRHGTGVEVVTRYEGGLLTEFGEAFDEEGLLELLDAYTRVSGPDSGFVPGLAIGCTMPASLAGHAAIPLEPAAGHGLLDAEAAPAAALAVSRLYTGLPSVNLLEPDQVRDLQSRIDRRDARRLLAGIGVYLLLLFAGSMTFRAWVERRHAIIEVTAAQLEPVARRHAVASDALDAERRRMVLANALMGDRTQVAGLLERIGRSVPESVVLDALSWETGDTAVGVILLGRAFKEAGVVDLVEALEALDAGRQVQLLSAGIDGKGSAHPWQFELRTELFGVVRGGG